MGRRRLSRDEARKKTRDEILTAARRLFGEHGYRGASLEQIADAAGYTKGAVYSNWSGKEALFLELLDREAEDGGYAEYDTEPGTWAMATLEFFVDAVSSPEVRSALAERYRQARKEAGRRMSRGRDDPDWATWEEIAALAMAVGSGLIIQNAIDPDALERDLAERVMRRLTDLD